MIKINNVEELYTMNTEELWNIVNLLEDDEKTHYLSEIESIKNGIYIKIPIIYIIKNWTEEHPESKRISIKGHGKYEITQYYDEVNERNSLMRRIIMENIDDDEPNQSRT